MINSLKDLINESTNNGLVDEMGVKNPERLTQSHMGRVRQETLRRQQTMASRPQTRTYNEAAADLTRALKQIRRTDITMEVPQGSRTYFPKFPEAIVTLMRELKGIDSNRFLNDFGRWRDVFPDSSAIYFKTEGPSDFQRSHFPNGGIPPALRGIGLGFKLYRTLLKFAGYISSNPSGTAEKDKAWGSMLTYKSNPDGTPSVDDAHAVIGAGNWMAIDKGVSTGDKINVVDRFLENRIGFAQTLPDRFDMDDELIEILPDFVLTKLRTEYLDSLVEDNRLTSDRYEEILAARSEAIRREEERRAREEAEARERRIRQEAEARQRAEAKIRRFGADMDAEWNVGDFIVVKQYLLDTGYDSLPIRRVYANGNNGYLALNLSDAIRVDAGNLRPTDAGDTRSVGEANKANWVKVEPSRIPDLTRVNLSESEQEYIRSFINDDARDRHDSERERETAARIERDRESNASRRDSQNEYRNIPQSGQELKDLVHNRPNLPNISLLKKIRSGDFAKYVILGPTQRAISRQYFGVPVFVPVRRVGRTYVSLTDINLLSSRPEEVVLVNVVNGEIVEGPFVGLDLVAYPLERVTEDDKLRTRGGDPYYIANHMNTWGIVAKADYTTRNTANQPFIYLSVFGGGNRPTPVRLDLLRKLGTLIQI